MSEPLQENFDRLLTRFLSQKRLGAWLAAIAVLLSSSCLALGFYLDDFVGRYIYSDLPDAAKLFELYAGGYGLANGNPADTHWQIEQGWAPWWTYDQLLIRLSRPLGVATHWLDFTLWPDQPWLMHLHSLLWLALLVLATTRMYRAAMSGIVAGLAALLFAFDHTHGFVVGYICNRHTLITALLSVLCLTAHLRARRLWGYALYTAALISGESAVAIAGYICAHALCVERGSALQRLRSIAPYVAITLVWRALYTHAGYGAVGSGLYIDPARDPLAYVLALLERAPVLVLGQFLAPPAELYSVWPTTWAQAMFVFACVFCVCLCIALWPLLRRDRVAMFWLLGALASLVPAASTYPHNRQLMFTSFGALGLLAQLWHLHVVELGNRAPSRLLHFSQGIGGMVFVTHMLISPLVLPITTCSIAVTSPLQTARAALDTDAAGRDVVFINAPDYFAVKLVQLWLRIAEKPLPRRFRALSFGPEHIELRRTAANALELEYAEGILSTPFMELYRDRRIPMQRGETIQLEGLQILVLDVTSDQRARKVRFTFDAALESDQLRFYAWNAGRFERFVVPALGDHVELPPAQLELHF
ncbi:MAG TPA: hypothetical protein VFN67_27210 [Polyangiales bacterium]|nr:hypothetical protein [Polyangiales bacterium]